MAQWYYEEDGQQCGPIDEADLVELFDSGQLGPDTRVWNEDLGQWRVARDVDGLTPPPCEPSPSRLRNSRRDSSALVSDYESSGKQVRPWVRYFARLIDGYLFAMLSGFYLAIYYPIFLEVHDIVFWVMALFVYVFVEPALLTGWGTTPGKALLKIRVRHSDGSKLSYRDALKRTFKVWLRGQGLGVPILNLFTYLTAYHRLVNFEMTTWDEEGDIKVSHQIVGARRIMAVIAFFLSVFFLLALGNSDI